MCCPLLVLVLTLHRLPLLFCGDRPANDFRLFVGDLGNEVTTEMLAKEFQKYKTFAKAKVRTEAETGLGCSVVWCGVMRVGYSLGMCVCVLCVCCNVGSGLMLT